MAGKDIPLEEARLAEECALAERTGWTLDYIRSIDFVEYQKVNKVYDAFDRARKFLSKVK